MEKRYDQVPDLKDAGKWLELEVKKEIIYGNSGNLIVPVGAQRYYREIINKKVGSGESRTITFFEKEPCLIFWGHAVLHKETGRVIVISYIALRMKSGKWATSNLMINGVSVEKDGNILHVHRYENEVWIFLKARNGWAIRKIKRSS